METILRVVVIYLFLLFGMRVLGKREFGQLSPHEFVILLIIPEMVSPALNRDDTTLTNALLGVATIMGLVFITSVLTHRFKPVETLVSDTATVLVHKGVVFENVLNKERVTPEEILQEGRKSGVAKMEEIKWAVLEPDGKIAIVPEQQQQGSNPQNQGGAEV